MKIKRLTPKIFRPYGYIINYPNKHKKGHQKNLFRIVVTENKCIGWRIAYLIVRDKHIHRLESHPDSFESFEPIHRNGLLFVAQKKNDPKIECFLLTKPVILKKGIWHGVISLSHEWELKLTENAKVNCVYWPLGYKLNKQGRSSS